MPVAKHLRPYYGYKWRTVTIPALRRRAGGRFEEKKYRGAAKCEKCGYIDCLPKGRSELDVAHLVIPPGEPGHDDDANLAVLCHACHHALDYPVWAAKTHATRVHKKDAARPILRLSEEDTLMTPILPEYATLSVRAGLIAGNTDEFLGGTAFVEFIRFHAWTLTPQFLIEMQSAALSLGVPAERFDNIDGFAAELLASHEFVRRAVALQAEADQRKGINHGRPV